jgi:aerobic-type carbon monoxide dehydrogenase small subunit (CoxS/CutS family)
MKDNVIEFDVARGLEGLEAKRKANKTPELIAALQREVEAAQQAYNSWQLIQGGYCGKGLKAEIEQAHSLPEQLRRAGLLMQQILMEPK